MPRRNRVKVIKPSGRICHKTVAYAENQIRDGLAELISTKPLIIREIPIIKFNGGCIGGKVYLPRDCKNFLASIRHEVGHHYEGTHRTLKPCKAYDRNFKREERDDYVPMPHTTPRRG